MWVSKSTCVSLYFLCYSVISHFDLFCQCVRYSVISYIEPLCVNNTTKCSKYGVSGIVRVEILMEN